MRNRFAVPCLVALGLTTVALSASAQTADPAQPAPAATPAPAAPAPDASPSSGGEATTDARALAETLFFTGRGLMEGKRYALACQKFTESYRLDPAAGTLINLAVCHEKEGKIASSWGEFRQALADAKRLNKPEREALAKDAIARIEPELPFVTITVPQPVRVDGLKLSANGVNLNAAAWDTELPVDPGEVKIVANAPLYKEETKTFTIAKREHKTITLDALELAPVERPPPPFWTRNRKIGAIVGGAGLAAVAVGTVFGLSTLSKKNDSDGQCPSLDGQLRCSTAGASSMSSAKTDAWIADFGIGVGAAAVLVGSYLFFIHPGGEEEGASGSVTVGAPTSWRFDVKNGAHGAEGVLTGTF